MTSAASSARSGAHARRANPRDALDHEGSVDVRLHRMIRRGTSYGPTLPDGVIEDDGIDRGIIFVFAGAHLKRQFEFVKTQWLNDGIFIGAPLESDPLVGPHGEPSSFTIPQRPIRRRLAGPPAVRRHPRRRVLLRAQPAGPAMARRAGHMTTRHPERGRMMGSSGTDRWAALDFAPPDPDIEETEAPVLLDYLADGRVAQITLNRPHADNAITTEMGALLTEVVEDVAVRTAVRVVILTGAGDRAFSVGSDLRQRKAMTKEDWLRQRQAFDRTLYTVRQLRKPIFAAVNGIAYGGGCELAQSTDFIIASTNATFGQPEAMLGLAAGGGSPALLPRLLPRGKALQMLMTGDPVPAQEAYRLGMVNELHEPDQLMGAAQQIADKIAGNSPDRRPGRQARGPPGRGTTDRASDRDHDGCPLALRGPSRPRRRHRRLQRRPRTHLRRLRLLTTRSAHRPKETETHMTVADDLEAARASLVMINPAPYNAEAPPAALAR